jgi:hypothetical protein
MRFEVLVFRRVFFLDPCRSNSVPGHPILCWDVDSQSFFSCRRHTQATMASVQSLILDVREISSVGPYIVMDFNRCHLCNRTFATPEGLTRHNAQKHKSQEDKSPYCNICEKEFASNRCLTIHRNRVHGDVHNFRCELCGKGFRYHNDFTRHLSRTTPCTEDKTK